MLHVSMFILTTLSLLTTLKAWTFIYIIKCNLKLANHPEMQHYLEETSTSDFASNILNKWQSIIFPAILLSTFNLFYIWYSISINHPFSQEYSIISTLLISTTLTYIIRFNTFPTWLTNWIELLMSVKKEIELDYLLQQLKQVKSKLQNHMNGTHTLSEQELNKLKQEGLFLHQISEQYKQ